MCLVRLLRQMEQALAERVQAAETMLPILMHSGILDIPKHTAHQACKGRLSCNARHATKGGRTLLSLTFFLTMSRYLTRSP